MDVNFDMSRIIRLLNKMGGQVKNLPLLSIGILLQTAIDDVIDAEGGGKWPKLAESTLKRRPRRKGGQLLQDRGMLASIQIETGDRWVMAGSGTNYAQYHVTGTKHMPERNFLDIDWDQFVRDAGDMIVNEVAG